MPGTTARLLLAIGGYAFTVVVLVSMATSGVFHWPDGDAYLWDRVGDQIRSGVDPYYATVPGGPARFFYMPPWGLAFAAISWLPVPLVAVGITTGEILALRYLAGSWLRVGYLCWIPLVPLELFASNFNLIMAASIAAAVNGQPRPALIMAAAKLSPAFAVDPRQWRRLVVPGMLMIAITVPWLWLWGGWLRQLITTYGINIGPGAELTIPLLPRLGVAVVLWALRRRWSRALAAVVATPVLYWASGILLLAFLKVAIPDLDAIRPRRRIDSSEAVLR